MSLTARTASGVAWSAVARIGHQATQVGVTILLARMLAPEDYGLIAMLMVFVGFATLFAEFGFGAALVHRPVLRPEHTASIFWINLGVGLVLAAAFVLTAPGIAAFYRNPALVPLARALAPGFVIGAVAVVPRALLQKRMEFRRLAQVEIAAAVGAGAVAVVMAAAGLGVWSLVAHGLLSGAIAAALALLLAGWMPRFTYSTAAVRDLFGYGANLFGFNSVNYWARNADGLLIGRFLGAAPLGIYSRAYSFMLLPLKNVVDVISRVMFPALASIQDDPGRVRNAYLRAMSTITLVAFPLVAGMFAAAEPFVRALLGERWLAVAPVLRILCGASILQTLLRPVGWLYQSQGRTDWMFRWGIGASVVYVGAIAAGVVSGDVTAVAWWYLGANAVLFWPGIALPGSLVGLRVRDVVGAAAGSLGCAVTMAAVVAVVGLAAPPGWPAGAVLALDVVLGIAVYAALVLRFRPRGTGELLGILKERAARRRAAASAAGARA